MSKSQKEGVFGVIEKLLADKGAKIEGKVDLTKEERAVVVRDVTAGIESGEIELSTEARAKYDTTEKLRGYVSGMVSNWLRKDERLNGGVQYEIKNPGSRAGRGDAQLTEMRKLLKITTDPTGRQAIEQAINERMATLKAETAKKVEVNFDVLPESLRNMFGHE